MCNGIDIDIDNLSLKDIGSASHSFPMYSILGSSHGTSQVQIEMGKNMKLSASNYMETTWNKSQNLHTWVPAWQKTTQAMLTSTQEFLQKATEPMEGQGSLFNYFSDGIGAYKYLNVHKRFLVVDKIIFFMSHRPYYKGVII